MKVGLVLGGGGFVGGAWLTGALEALEAETGWLPRTADYLVGTSAGAMIAGLTAAGVPACQIPDIFVGAEVQAELADQMVNPRGAALRWQPGWPALGSAKVAFNAVRRPGSVPLGVALAAMLPRGFLSTEPLKETVRRIVPDGWVGHDNLWLTATDLCSGERTVFGRKGAPRANLAEAIAASCAIPGFYAPVKVEGRLYVDGGCWSPSNLDVLAETDVNLVICFNPTSSMYRPTQWRERLTGGYRRASGRQLAGEARALRRTGARVLMVQPTAEDLVVMGLNLMRTGNLAAVEQVATETVLTQLRSVEARPFTAALRAQAAGRELPAANPGAIMRLLGPQARRRPNRAA